MPNETAIETWLVQSPLGLLVLGVGAIVLYESLKRICKGIGRFVSWAWPKFVDPAKNKVVSLLARPALNGLVMCLSCKESKQPEKIVVYAIYVATKIIAELLVGLFAFNNILTALRSGKSDEAPIFVGICFVVLLDFYRDSLTMVGIAKGTFEIQLRETNIRMATKEGMVAGVAEFIAKNPGVFLLKKKRESNVGETP